MNDAEVYILDNHQISRKKQYAFHTYVVGITLSDSNQHSNYFKMKNCMTWILLAALVVGQSIDASICQKECKGVDILVFCHMRSPGRRVSLQTYTKWSVIDFIQSCPPHPSRQACEVCWEQVTAEADGDVNHRKMSDEQPADTISTDGKCNLDGRAKGRTPCPKEVGELPGQVCIKTPMAGGLWTTAHSGICALKVRCREDEDCKEIPSHSKCWQKPIVNGDDPAFMGTLDGAGLCIPEKYYKE